jgi:hypothetical protein
VDLRALGDPAILVELFKAFPSEQKVLYETSASFQISSIQGRDVDRQTKELTLIGCVSLSLVNWCLRSMVNLERMHMQGNEFTETLEYTQ